MDDKELFTVALNKAMNQCSQREYSVADMRSKLASWGIDNDDSEKILEILIMENFINETRYASAFVSDKFKYNKWGKVKITANLKAKNIPGEAIRLALDNIDNEQYIKFIREHINGHRRKIKAKNQYDLKAKLLRYGLSKGFESSLLYEILNELEE